MYVDIQERLRIIADDIKDTVDDLKSSTVAVYNDYKAALDAKDLEVVGLGNKLLSVRANNIDITTALKEEIDIEMRTYKNETAIWKKLFMEMKDDMLKRNIKSSSIVI